MSASTPSSREPGEAGRQQRVDALFGLGEAAIPGLIEELALPGFGVRRRVMARLVELGKPAARALCATLTGARASENQLAAAVDTLSTIREDIDDDLLELAAHEEPAVVCDAVQILGRRRSLLAVPRLSALCRHSNDNVALSAVEALGRIGSGAALDSLLELAQGDNFFRVFPCIDVLGRSGDRRALPLLVRMLREPLYASEAARALGRLADLSVTVPLVTELALATDGLVRPLGVALAAIHAASLARFGTAAVVERALFESPHLPRIRRQIEQSLARADVSERAALGRILAIIADENSTHVLLSLLEEQGDAALTASDALKRLVASAEPQLIEALMNASAARRLRLIPLLQGRASASEALRNCLTDEEPAVRALACEAFAHSSDASAVPALFELLDDPDLGVAHAALGAIQALGGTETERLALAAGHSPSPRVRRAALRIIGYFGYPRGFALLEAAARGEDERLRDIALAALPFLEHPGTLGLLLLASEHVSAHTRAAAVRALAQVPASALTLDRLRRALADQDPWVRYYACQSLGRLGDEASTEAIAELLTDPCGQVQVAAVDALALLRGARAFQALRAISSARDPDLRRAALVALGSSKRAEALPPLLEALSSSEPATRLVAVSALAELGLPETANALAASAHDTDARVQNAALAFLAASALPQATAELIELLSLSPFSAELFAGLSRPVPGRVSAILSALDTANEATAPALVAALARSATPERHAALLQAFSRRNSAARRAAASALIAFDEPSTAELLARAATSDTDPEVRRICAASLRK